MIARHRLYITCDNQRIIPSFWAYRAYSWLMSNVPEYVADDLHINAEKPISTAIWYDKERNANCWEVSTMADYIEDAVFELLGSIEEIPLNAALLRVVDRECVRYDSPEELVRMSDVISDADKRLKLSFLTPTSFKQAGRYAIFPQIPLILGSLARSWNMCFPEYCLSDDDALEAIAQNLFIVDYSLRSARYALKGMKIAGFYGDIIVESRLPSPLEAIWQMMTAIAPISGVGIKTALGMGKISCTRNIYGQ